MHEARLWKPLDDGGIKCGLCSQFCTVNNGERGFCGVRENREGKLYTLVYDRVAALNMDPVEKKPLYHFMPDTMTFSLGTSGCNFSCKFCQNNDLSQTPRLSGKVDGHQVTPEGLVKAALHHGAASISYTYSEPTVFFELMQDTGELAHDQGLKNIMVSNGFQSPICLDELGPVIHAANIDLKAFTDKFYQEQCGARLKPVLNNLKHIRELGWWLEVTTLLIPGLNDDPSELSDLAGFIASELGVDTPWHLSRFTPRFKMTEGAPTSLEALQAAHTIGKSAGLNYVYIGNIPGNDAGNTYCPGCGVRIIDRMGFSVGEMGVKKGICTKCGQEIPGVFI